MDKWRCYNDGGGDEPGRVIEIEVAQCGALGGEIAPEDMGGQESQQAYLDCARHHLITQVRPSPINRESLTCLANYWDGLEALGTEKICRCTRICDICIDLIWCAGKERLL